MFVDRSIYVVRSDKPILPVLKIYVRFRFTIVGVINAMTMTVANDVMAGRGRRWQCAGRRATAVTVLLLHLNQRCPLFSRWRAGGGAVLFLFMSLRRRARRAPRLSVTFSLKSAHFRQQMG